MTDINKAIIHKLGKNKTLFSAKDIKDAFANNRIELTGEALRKRIHAVKKEGLIKSVKKGTYTTIIKPDYTFRPDYFIDKIRREVTDVYDDAKICIWKSSVFHEFMIHQPFTSFYILEIEKELSEPIFGLLRDNNRNVFFDPKKKLIENYFSESINPIYSRKLISRSPLRKIGKNSIPKLEKMLVDLFCDDDVFYMYQGEEKNNITERALRNYHVNYTTLLSYAGARAKKQEYATYLKELININPKLLQ